MGRPVANEITFYWDGDWTTTVYAGHFPTQTSLPVRVPPAYGWASWPGRTDLLRADIWSDLEVGGGAHRPGGAPGSGLPDEEPENVLYEPRTWVGPARLIAGAVRGQELPGHTGQTFQ